MLFVSTLFCAAGSFSDCQKLIDFNIFKGFYSTTNPSDLDTVYLCAISQPKVNTHTIMALIPTTAMDLFHKR